MTEPSLARLPGRVVSAGRRLVHVVEREGSGPPVLLLGGCGVPYYVWDPVTELLPDRHLVLMDRPGLVATPWPGRLPTLAEEVDTLADLVATLDAPPIAVAHSMAGLHVEALVRRHPEALAGVVLVDGSFEPDPMPPTDVERWRRRAQGAQRMMRTLPATRPLGSLGDRLIAGFQSRRLGLFEHRPDIQRAVYREPDAVASVIAEQAAYDDQINDLAELRLATDWPGVATQVLTATLEGGAEWTRHQAALCVELDAEHVVVFGSRHLMMIDRPDAVATAVRALS